MACSNCNQPFNLMIKFECSHLECIFCFAMRESATLPLKCHSCDQPTSTFRYSFQTLMACDACKQQKSVDEFWWCDQCCDTLCSLCAMQAHKDCQATTWDRMQSWKFFVRQSTQRIEILARGEKQKIDNFLAEVQKELYAQIDQSAKDALNTLKENDGMVSSTFEIVGANGVAKPIDDEGAGERKRLRVKRHLSQLMQGLKFGSRSLNFDLHLKRFESPPPDLLNAKMNTWPIDGASAANK